MAALTSNTVPITGTVAFLGLTLQPSSMPEMNQLVEQGIRERQKWIIANHNLHSVYLFHRHPKLREFYSRADYTYVDGMPLVALGRLYGYPLQREHRVTNADWTIPLMQLAAKRVARLSTLVRPSRWRKKAQRSCAGCTPPCSWK